MTEDMGASGKPDQAAPATQRSQQAVSGKASIPSADDHDRFIFDWFNERDPSGMRACLDAYDAMLTTRQEQGK